MSGSEDESIHTALKQANTLADTAEYLKAQLDDRRHGIQNCNDVDDLIASGEEAVVSATELLNRLRALKSDK